MQREAQPGRRCRGESFGPAAFPPGLCHHTGAPYRARGPPPRVPARSTSEILGLDRGRSGATGAARVSLGPARAWPSPCTWLSSGPLCFVVPSPTRGRSPRTEEGSGREEEPGTQKLFRSALPGAACTPAPPEGPRAQGGPGHAPVHPTTSRGSLPGALLPQALWLLLSAELGSPASVSPSRVSWI